MDASQYDGNGPFEKGAFNEKYSAFITGKSYRAGLSTEQVIIDNVTFEPGSRTKWHIHHSGEILLVTGGVGWHQEEGKPAQKIQQGDVINVKPRNKHWHGAAKNAWMTHIAITVPAEDMGMDILEPVSEADYNSLE